MTKFQDELKAAIAEWHDAMNSEDIDVIRLYAGKNLAALIERAVDCETTDNAEFDDDE
jgi:ketosteroid isomerase-like protein